MSMISEQIRTLRDVAQAFEDSGIDTLLRGAANTIEELSAKLQSANMERSSQFYNNGWIPCREGLPENNRIVLCWVRSTTIASGETFVIGSCDGGFWFLQTHEIGHHHFPVKDYKVLAWQPLPEPYNPDVSVTNVGHKTNADKIRSMSDEQMASIMDKDCLDLMKFRKCPNRPDNGVTCSDCYLKWLKAESEG